MKILVSVALAAGKNWHRSPKRQKDPVNYLLTDVRPWSGWWAEVKSGERTFSFNGQANSYRFHADGSAVELAT